MKTKKIAVVGTVARKAHDSLVFQLTWSARKAGTAKSMPPMAKIRPEYSNTASISSTANIRNAVLK